MNRDKFFIGGDWVDPAGTDTLAVISPATEEVIAKVPDATTVDVDRAVAAARARRSTPVRGRGCRRPSAPT